MTTSQIKEKITACGLKGTHQRIAIYDALLSLENHPTAEKIYNSIKKKYPTISLGTVYKTLETFVAGTFFALATNFILLGSSKIFNIILVYIDALTGFPARNLGKLKNTKTFNKIPLNYVWMLCSGYGQLIGIIKNITKGYDKFVGDYLVIITSIYITFKFIHYRFF